jgi:hypothetical protein
MNVSAAVFFMQERICISHQKRAEGFDLQPAFVESTFCRIHYLINARFPDGNPA